MWGKARKRRTAKIEVTTVVGAVRSIGETLEAPLSGTACVTYQATVRFRTDGVPLAWQQHQIVRFELESEHHGTVLVDAPEARVLMLERPLDTRDVERETAFLQPYGMVPRDDLSFFEVAIVPGQRVAVRGVLASETAPAGELPFRDAGRPVTRLVPHPEHELTIGEAP